MPNLGCRSLVGRVLQHIRGRSGLEIDGLIRSLTTQNGRVQRVTISYCARTLATLMIGRHLSISALALKLSGQGQELSEVRESKHQGRGREAQPEHSPQADDGEIRRDMQAVAVSNSYRAWNAVCIFRNGSHGGLLRVLRSCLPAADRPG